MLPRPPARTRPVDPWLIAVLARGTSPEPLSPWRCGASAADARALRDGLLHRVVADVVVPVGVEVDAPVRAAALDLLLPPGVVVLAGAALWVHLGAPVPSPQEVHVAGNRLPDLRTIQPGGPHAGRTLPVRFSRVRPVVEEVTRIGPLALTTPARSLLDVAVTHPHRAARLRTALIEAGLLDAVAVEGADRRARGRAGIRTARRALRLPRAGLPQAPTLAGRPDVSPPDLRSADAGRADVSCAGAATP